MQWFVLVDFLLAGIGVWLLLVAYRLVGKPPGTDEKYDAWHRQHAVTLKLIGWGWAVLMGSCLVVAQLL